MTNEEKTAAVDRVFEVIRAELIRAAEAGMPSHTQFSIIIACAAAIAQSYSLADQGRVLTREELAAEFLDVLGSVEIIHHAPTMTTTHPQGTHEGKPS